jgi:hypothetical protein
MLKFVEFWEFAEKLTVTRFAEQIGDAVVILESELVEL